MEKFETHNELVKHLVGVWKSEDNKQSFRFVGTGIVDIVGLPNKRDGQTERDTYLLLENDNGWKITEGKIFDIYKQPFIVDRHTIKVMDGSTVPNKEVYKFNRDLSIRD